MAYMRASQDEKKTILSRRDLYELVWSTPVTKLAEQFGISDRGLAKICERHRVPSPPRGYWAKLDAGAKPKRAIFVDTSDEALNVIKINSTLSAMPPEARLIVEKARAERKAQKASKSAKRATEQPKLEPVDQVHPLIAATAKTIRKQRGPGMVHVSGAGLMSLRLGPDGVERVLSFLDTLIRRLEGNGLAVSLADKGMKVALGIDDAVFTVSERTTWELHEPTEEELAAEKRRQAKIEKARLAGSWSIDWSSRAYPERDEIPRGELVLQVEGWWDGVRRRWADGKTQRLETLLDSIVTGFEVLLASRKARRLEREQRARDEAELARRQVLAEERRKREKKRRDLLREVMSKSNEATTIRQWLSSADPGEGSESEEFGRFVAWARQRLAALEDSISRRNVAEVVRTQELFPLADELHDPQGEPPRRYYYGMPVDDE